MLKSKRKDRVDTFGISFLTVFDQSDRRIKRFDFIDETGDRAQMEAVARGHLKCDMLIFIKKPSDQFQLPTP